MLNGHKEAQVKGMNGPLITKMIASGLMLAMLIAFAAPAAAETVAAEDPEAEEFYYRRAIMEEYKSHSAMIVSAKQTPEGSDFVVFAIDTKGDDDKGLGVGVLYGHGGVNGGDDWEHATGTFMAPFAVVEFVDDGDGVFTLGGNNGDDGDDVISVLPLHADLDERDGFYEQTGETDDTMSWLPRPGYENVAHERVNGPQDSTEIDLSAKTTDGIFELMMHISNSVILSEEIILSPYEIKLDFVIEDYPYESEDSILGLCSIVASANANWNIGLPETYDDWRSEVEEDGLYFDMGDVSDGVGYFSWYKTAQLDGVDTDVGHSTLAQISAFEWTDEKATRIDLKYVAFTYGRADSIIHDPKLGFAPVWIESMVRGNPGLFFLSAFLFVGMVVGIRWYKRKGSMPQRVDTPPVQQMPPQAPPAAPPQTPPQGPAAAPPQVGYPPQGPPGSPPGGAQ
jgi:hypothetical protein